MASRIFYNIQAADRELKQIFGTIFPAGTGAPTKVGVGFSVARTSAGLFTITLDDLYPSLVSKWCSLSLATPATDHHLQFDAEDVATAGTITLTHLTGGVAADIAANADNNISFGLILKNIP